MDHLPANILKRVTRELLDLQAKPAEGVRVILNEQNITDIVAELDGPVGTPFEGGLFRMRLTLGSDFPQSPPKGVFMTKVFHPNVSKAGEICVNVLKKDWTPDTELRHVLMVIRCLLIQPFPDSALNEEAGKLLLEDYEEYSKHARLMTSIHAQHPKRPTPLTTSGANASNSTGTSTDAKKEEGSSSPAQKKARPEHKGVPGGVSKVKKSLKRL